MHISSRLFTSSLSDLYLGTLLGKRSNQIEMIPILENYSPWGHVLQGGYRKFTKLSFFTTHRTIGKNLISTVVNKSLLLLSLLCHAA